MKLKASKFAPIAAAIAALLLGSASAYATQYSVTNLGSFGYGGSVAQGINSTGEVVGYSTNSAGNINAFLYSNGTMQNLGTFGGTTSLGRGINSTGEVVGHATNSAGNTNAFLYSNGTMQNLGTLGALPA